MKRQSRKFHWKRTLKNLKESWDGSNLFTVEMVWQKNSKPVTFFWSFLLFFWFPEISLFSSSQSKRNQKKNFPCFQLFLVSKYIFFTTPQSIFLSSGKTFFFFFNFSLCVFFHKIMNLWKTIKESANEKQTQKK